LNSSQRAVLYAAYLIHSATRGRGFITRIRATCNEILPGFSPQRPTIYKWVQRYDANGGHNVIFKPNSTRTGISNKLSVAGVRDLQETCLGKNYRGVANSFQFDSKHGVGKIDVSPWMVKKSSRDAGQELSLPIKIGLRSFTPHHLRVRTFVCDTFLANRLRGFLKKMIFSDEMPWPMTLNFNSKNDVIIVAKGQRAVTNLHHRAKGDEKACFSLHWSISQFGVLYFVLYEENMDMALFENFMVDKMAPALEEAKLDFSVFVHDHVSNSRQKFPQKTMDSVFGKDKWLKHPPAICKIGTGNFRHVDFVWSKGKNKGKRCVYDREIFKPAEICECKLEKGIYADLAADMNICENAQGMLRKMVNDMIKNNEISYGSSVKSKMKAVATAIEKLNSNQTYWQKLFGTLRKRYKWISDNGGQKYAA